MTTKIDITEDAYRQICDQAIGIRGVEVEDHHHPGTKFVLMSVEGYQQLQQLAYDDSEWTAEEMLAAAASALVDPEDWDAEGMSEYDKLNPTTPEP